MDGDQFGTDPALPENVREVFKHLCQELAMLHAKWELFLGLFDTPEKAALLSEMAGWSFRLIQGAMLHDVAMTISRLGDSKALGGLENISLANLAGRCPDVSRIAELLAEFQAAYEPVKAFRNKMVGHNDMASRVEPASNPVPGLTRDAIDLVIQRAGDILNAVSLHYSHGERSYGFVPMPAFGGADSLLSALRALLGSTRRSSGSDGGRVSRNHGVVDSAGKTSEFGFQSVGDSVVSRETFESAISELVTSITACAEAKLQLPSLILMYTGIDTLAGFTLPRPDADVTRTEFKRWAKTYMVDPNPDLRANEHDLYGMRCGLLHAMQAESRSSREGHARMIFLVHRPANRDALQRAIDAADQPVNAVAVYYDDLLRAFAEGAMRFRIDLEANPVQAEIAYRRADKIPVYHPAELFLPRS